MSKSATILLVDDDDSLRDALSKNIEKAGYTVTTANNGKTALSIFQTHSFDLIISDIRMPEMDGLELVQKIRAQSLTTPIILVTGFSDLTETQEAHKRGANDFLTKPFLREDLETAIKKCLDQNQNEDSEANYGKLAIADFLSGRQIQFNIFLRLAGNKYVKVAHQGEDLSIDRVRAYEEKGVHHLYLLKDDFRKYLGFNLRLTKAVQNSDVVSQEKKLHLAKHTGEVILATIGSHGLNENTFEDASSFLKTAVDVIAEDEKLLNLAEMLQNYSDYHYAHSVGVSFYSVAMAKLVGWNLAPNRFKVALAGLFHDIGEKEVPLEILKRDRASWSHAELKIFEGHPLRGVEILSGIASIPDEVLQVVKEHHEDCLAQGFPSRLKKNQIYPMAKLVSVADRFCELVVPNPLSPGLSPKDALSKMNTLYSERIDKQFFEALKQLFAAGTR